jgi:hypothetical protein
MKKHVIIAAVFTLLLTQILVAGGDTKLVISKNCHDIQMADLDGSNLTTTLTVNGNQGGVAIDSRNGYMYWAVSSGYGQIQRSRLDGSGLETIINGTSFAYGDSTKFFTDVAIDSNNNKLYFSDLRSRGIYRSNFDGSNVEVIASSSGGWNNSNGIWDISLDLVHSRLYWSDSYYNRVYSASLDGSNRKVLYSSVKPYGVDVDAVHNKVFWTGSGKVFSAALDGTNVQQLYSGMWWSTAVTVDQETGKLFWNDIWYSGPTNYDSKIYCSDIYGQNVQTLFNFGPTVCQRTLYLSVETIPEPATLLLLGLGGLMLRRKK